VSIVSRPPTPDPVDSGSGRAQSPQYLTNLCYSGNRGDVECSALVVPACSEGVKNPAAADESIDLDVLEREIDWLFDRGADGIVMAMVSETLRLASEERDVDGIFLDRLYARRQ
jgi:hypothetical protein